MKKVSVFSIVTACCLISAGIVHATDFPLSQYGQIQNVQSYSSNPFYNINGPYNQRLPTPVYAQGTELNAGECRSVVDSIVYGQCAQKNNCDKLSYTDIRPAVMLELSKLSGHNYITSCNGYIQASFEDYKKNNSAATITSFPSVFPTVESQTEKASNKLVVSNPFELKDPDWQKDRNARQGELRNLQKQNGSDDVALDATKFPTTYADLSFTERMENDKAGYELWKDAQAYKPIKIESEETLYQREVDIAGQKLELAKKQEELSKLKNHCGWCYEHKSECYSDLAKQRDDLNKGRKDSACANKIPGTDTSYISWDVVSDTECGWALKDGNRTVLTDIDCGTANPNNTGGTSSGGNAAGDNPIVIDLG